jgi:hypothetical protein
MGDRNARPGAVAPGEPVTAGPDSTREPAPGPARAARHWRPQLTSPALRGLAALCIYLGAWIGAEALPLVADPGWAQLDQASMDPNSFVWCLRWWPYAVAHGLNPLHTTALGAPSGFGLAWVTSVPPLGLLAAPLTAAAGPVVSFNLLIAVALPVSGWAAFAVCHRLTGKFWPALAGGAVYGFSAYELNHVIAGQLNLAVSLLLPVIAYLVLLWWQRAIGSAALVALLAVAMAAQFYLFLETFADMTAVLALALLAGYLLAGRPARRTVARLALLVAAGYLGALVLASPYLAYALTHVPPGFNRSPAGTALDLASLVLPRPGQTFGLAWLAGVSGRFRPPARDGYVGIPLLVLTALFGALTWSRRFTRFLLVMVVLIILLALGPNLHVAGHRLFGLPWARVWYLPLARSGYPARMMVFAFLALAVLVALWLAGPTRRRRGTWGRWLLALLALAAIGANTPALAVTPGPGLPGFITTGQYGRYLHRNAVVVVISELGNTGMLWQAHTNFYFRLAGGYINHAITPTGDLPAPVARLHDGLPVAVNAGAFRAYLRNAGVSAILVQADESGLWPTLLRQAGLRGHTVGGVIVFRTAAGRGGRWRGRAAPLLRYAPRPDQAPAARRG